MKAMLDHVALNVRDFEWYLNFFEEVFNMKEEKRQGDMPYRKFWLDGGIQLCECQVETGSAGPMDHHFIECTARENDPFQYFQLFAERIKQPDRFIFCPYYRNPVVHREFSGRNHPALGDCFHTVLKGDNPTFYFR